MKFTELNEKLGGSENQSDWRQSAGGGWLHKSAVVENEKLITENAIVWGKVFGNAMVSGDAQVSGDARVFGDAQVFGDARVFGDAMVSGDARVFGNAQVFGDAWVKSPLFVIGSRFSLTNAKKGHIQIGCRCQTFAWWKKHGLKLAKENAFTKAEIAEYTALVNLFCEIGL